MKDASSIGPSEGEEDDHRPTEPPRPPQAGSSEGMYALGIWKGGQTLYRFERNPLSPNDNDWREIGHFNHDDSEVQSINFGEATAKPHLADDDSLRAVWLYTESLSNEKSSSTSSSREDKHAEHKTGEESEKRDLGDVGRDTAHHKVLAAVSQRSDGYDDPVSVKEIIANSTVPEGTVYASMTQLWERKLVERRDREHGVKRKHKVYWLSTYGAEVLREIGEPDMD